MQILVDEETLKLLIIKNVSRELFSVAQLMNGATCGLAIFQKSFKMIFGEY